MARGIHRAGIFLAAVCCAFSFSSRAKAADPALLTPAETARIDAAVKRVMEKTKVPGISIAVVRDGKIAYLRAYGLARVPPGPVAATTATRFGIGSVSKQFTAAAVLLLAEDGKLGLDDPVGRYIPDLTDGNAITIRQVLSHVSGYEDYWPQDYVPPEMLKPITTEAILARWGRMPLDFQPGTQWQYSNTNYTIAGLIVEKVSGMKLMDFLQKRIFAPLHMEGVDEVDSKALPQPDAAGYTRVELGPLHPAPQTAPGWLFSMGQLAMTPRTLALWDISMIDRSLLSAKSYAAMMTPAPPMAAGDSHYGLGVFLSGTGRRRTIWHDGEISGFLTQNMVWPELHIAVVVVVNADQVAAQFQIADEIANVVLPPGESQEEEKQPAGILAGSATADQEARALFASLQQGKVDPAKLSENAKAYFTPEALKDAATGLGSLGALKRFTPTGDTENRGGMAYRCYMALCEHGRVLVSTFTWKDGLIEQFLVIPLE